MFKNRFLVVLGLLSLLLVAMSGLKEAQRIKQNQAADTARWEAMGEYYRNQADAEHKEAPPYLMDSATRSYIAWGKALQATGKLSESDVCSTTSQENIFAGIPNNLDSATRSYIAWGPALLAKNDIRALCR